MEIGLPYHHWNGACCVFQLNLCQPAIDPIMQFFDAFSFGIWMFGRIRIESNATTNRVMQQQTMPAG
jgi:hypothetical protein